VSAASTWHRFRTELRQAVNETTWHIWLEPVTLHSLEGETLVLVAPDGVRAWVQGRFAPLLQACAETVLGPGARVQVRGPEQPVSVPPAAASGWAGTASARQELDPRMTFEQFVIGDSNRMAHAAALAVAEIPALAYNPLFICGPPGLGKTHLLHSIANYVTDHGDGLSVRYTTGEAFTDHFVGALHRGGLEAFKIAYRGVDVLLVDDVQFLQRKARTEEEFFHTFNELRLAGAQIVLTSDRPPRDLDALEDRLRERFEAGLVCEVKPADRATRLTILRKRVLQDEIRGVEPEALELIADRVVTNIRVLEGALIRVVAFASLTRQAVTAPLVEEVLAGLYPELQPRRRTIEDIQRKTCEAFDVTLDELLSPSKAQRVALARQLAMYLARELTDETLPSIGRAFGNRNHTTVLHACRRTAERIASDPEAYDAVRRLTEALGAR
jgi:chromosomal replication initiator protein